MDRSLYIIKSVRPHVQRKSLLDCQLLWTSLVDTTEFANILLDCDIGRIVQAQML